MMDKVLNELLIVRLSKSELIKIIKVKSIIMIIMFELSCKKVIYVVMNIDYIYNLSNAIVYFKG